MSILNLDTRKMTTGQKKVFFQNTFFPGLGFFYSFQITYGFLFGVLSVLSVCYGIIKVLSNPVQGVLLWTVAILLHLVGIVISPSIKVKKTSISLATLYLLLSLGAIIFSFYRFILNLLNHV